MNEISLPNTGRKTTQLAFGCAFLASDGMEAAESRRLLDAAYDCGIKHYDTAPRYGQGHNESLLGRFLACHPGELSVTTKYGLIPPTPTKRVIDAVRRRAKFVPGFLFGRIGGKRGNYSVKQLSESIEASRKNLQVDHIDVLVFHEPRVSDLRGTAVLNLLQQKQAEGIIGSHGTGGDSSDVKALYEQRRPYCPVMMFDWACHQPKPELPGTYQIHFRSAAPAAKHFKTLLEKDSAMLRQWNEKVNLDLLEGDNLYALCLRASMAEFPNSLVVFSSKYVAHIRRTVEITELQSLSEPTEKFRQLVTAHLTR